MTQPFLGEIRIFAGNFAIRNWALCNGQILPISQNTALFALLGVTYGGDGKTNFALPNFQGSAPMHWGQGSGLTYRSLGEQSGDPSVTLTQSQMAAHNHNLQVVPRIGNQPSPTGTPSLSHVGNLTGGLLYKQASGASTTPMNSQITTLTGDSAPHNNNQPFLGLTFLIALQGIFPQRP